MQEDDELKTLFEEIKKKKETKVNKYAINKLQHEVILQQKHTDHSSTSNKTISQVFQNLHGTYRILELSLRSKIRNPCKDSYSRK